MPRWFGRNGWQKKLKIHSIKWWKERFICLYSLLAHLIERHFENTSGLNHNMPNIKYPPCFNQFFSSKLVSMRDQQWSNDDWYLLLTIEHSCHFYFLFFAMLAYWPWVILLTKDLRIESLVMYDMPRCQHHLVSSRQQSYFLTREMSIVSCRHDQFSAQLASRLGPAK